MIEWVIRLAWLAVALCCLDGAFAWKWAATFGHKEDAQ